MFLAASFYKITNKYLVPDVIVHKYLQSLIEMRFDPLRSWRYAHASFVLFDPIHMLHLLSFLYCSPFYCCIQLTFPILKRFAVFNKLDEKKKKKRREN